MFVWRKERIFSLGMEGQTYFHDAIEVFTDEQGRFSVPNSPKADWSLSTYVHKQRPDFAIFAPGYGAATLDYPRLKSGETDWDDQIGALARGAVVALPPLKTREEFLRFQVLGDVGMSYPVPSTAVPNLETLLNEHRRKLGLDPADKYQGWQRIEK